MFQIGEGLEKFHLVQAVVAKIEPFPENVIAIIKSCSFSKSLANKLVPILFYGYISSVGIEIKKVNRPILNMLIK